jgi:hypothetical protein
MPQPEIITPQFLHLNVQATSDRPSVAIRVIHSPRTGTYANASVAIEHPMIAVTTTRIAKLRLGTLRRDALRAALAEANVELSKIPAVKSFFKGTNGRPVSERVHLNPTPENLANAALIYRLARLTGDFPMLAIARSFSISPNLAKRWVFLARSAGALS